MPIFTFTCERCSRGLSGYYKNVGDADRIAGDCPCGGALKRDEIPAGVQVALKHDERNRPGTHGRTADGSKYFAPANPQKWV